MRCMSCNGVIGVGIMGDPPCSCQPDRRPWTPEERAALDDVLGSMRTARHAIEALAIEWLDRPLRDNVFSCFDGWSPWGWWRTMDGIERSR